MRPSQFVANLAGVEDQVGVEHLLDLLHQAHVDLTHGLSQIGNLAGADAVIFTSYGGRFPFPPKLCLHICSGTACGMGRLKSIFPVPSGGMRWEIFDELVRIYGQDIILLVGGALQTHNTDLTESVSFFLQKLKDAQSQ